MFGTSVQGHLFALLYSLYLRITLHCARSLARSHMENAPSQIDEYQLSYHITTYSPQHNNPDPPLLDEHCLTTQITTITIPSTFNHPDNVRFDVQFEPQCDGQGIYITSLKRVTHVINERRT